MTNSFLSRIKFSGNFDNLMARVTREYELGKVLTYEIIEVGFEDLNVKLVTKSGEYLVKLFSKNRNHKQVIRYVDTIKIAIEGGVSHPILYKNNSGDELHIDSESGVYLSVMAYIKGKTFYEMSRIPNDTELRQIIDEAVKINKIQYEPEYVNDSWAIPNMRWMFDKTKDSLSKEGLLLVEEAFKYFDEIMFDKLPKSFVHGDIIKTNIIKTDNDKMNIIDFAVSNTYPRVQELAVMAANLLFDNNSSSQFKLRDRVNKIIKYYELAGGVLTEYEKDSVFNYALPGAAMEYMGSINERINGDDSSEIIFWERQGLETLREALT